MQAPLVQFPRSNPKVISAERIRSYERSKGALQRARDYLKSFEREVMILEERNRQEGSEIAAALVAGARIVEE